MKKITTFITALLVTFSLFSTTHNVNSGNFYYVPQVLTINIGDTVNWVNDGGLHNVNFDISTISGSSFNNPEAFISIPTNNSNMYTHIFTIAGNYEYDCSVGQHAANGMIGTIIVNSAPDCNGIVNGTSVVDDCGVCQQAYLYNFIAHTATFVDNANILIAGVDYDPSVEMLVLPGDPGDPYWNSSCSNTIYDIVSNSSDHTTLKAAIDACGLDGYLSGAGPFTLFAPTDAAFNLLPPGTVSSLISNIPLLTDILKHHVVADSVMSGMISPGQTIITLLGTDVAVTINSTGVYIDNAMVIAADLVGDNGVVHVIDAVLLPAIDCFGIVNGTALTDTCGTCHQAYLYNFQTNVPTFVDNANILVAGVDYDPSTEFLVFPNDTLNPLWESDPALCSNTIYDIVSNSSDHTTLKAAIDACGLDGYLSGAGPFTLFAPTDAAFNLLPAGTVAALLADLPQLTDILKHHVVADSVMSGMLSPGQTVTTLLGTDVTVTINSTGVYIDNAMVILADLVGDNGVVHVIDAVLLPPTTSISEYNSSSKYHTYMYSLNILGERIERNVKNQIIFDVYDNGNIIKRFIK